MRAKFKGKCKDCPEGKKQNDGNVVCGDVIKKPESICSLILNEVGKVVEEQSKTI